MLRHRFRIQLRKLDLVSKILSEKLTNAMNETVFQVNNITALEKNMPFISKISTEMALTEGSQSAAVVVPLKQPGIGFDSNQ